MCSALSLHIVSLCQCQSNLKKNFIFIILVFKPHLLSAPFRLVLALGILTLIYTVFNTIEHCFGYFMKGEDLPDGIILGAYVSIFKEGEDMYTIYLYL